MFNVSVYMTLCIFLQAFFGVCYLPTFIVVWPCLYRRLLTQVRLFHSTAY